MVIFHSYVSLPEGNVVVFLRLSYSNVVIGFWLSEHALKVQRLKFIIFLTQGMMSKKTRNVISFRSRFWGIAPGMGDLFAVSLWLFSEEWMLFYVINPLNGTTNHAKCTAPQSKQKKLATSIWSSHFLNP